MKRNLHRELHHASSLWAELSEENVSWSGLPLTDRQAIVRAIAHDPELVAQLTRETRHNSGTTTSFGRRKQTLEGAMKRMAGKLPKNPKILDIGLELSSPSGWHLDEISVDLNPEYWRSLISRQYVYEPFEVLALMERFGFCGTELTAFDIDPLVLATLRYQKEMIVEARGKHGVSYYSSFLQRTAGVTVLPSDGGDFHSPRNMHLVQLPERWTQSVERVQGDVEVVVPFEKTFDLALCFAVLLYVQDKVNGKDAALFNIVRALRLHGFLLTTNIDRPRLFGLEEVKGKNFDGQHCFRKVKEVR